MTTDRLRVENSLRARLPTPDPNRRTNRKLNSPLAVLLLIDASEMKNCCAVASQEQIQNALG
jgi:hypothetical protein